MTPGMPTRVVGARWRTVSGALAEGVTDTALAAVEDQDAEQFDRRTWAALAWADARTRADLGPVPVEFEDELARHYSPADREDLDLVTTVMCRNTRIVSTLRLGLANRGIFVRSVPHVSQLTTHASDASRSHVPVRCGSAIPDRPIGARTVACFTGQRATSAVRASTGAGCARALGTAIGGIDTATPVPISRSDCLTVALSSTVSHAVADAPDRPYVPVPRGAGIVAELAAQVPMCTSTTWSSPNHSPPHTRSSSRSRLNATRGSPDRKRADRTRSWSAPLARRLGAPRAPPDRSRDHRTAARHRSAVGLLAGGGASPGLGPSSSPGENGSVT